MLKSTSAISGASVCLAPALGSMVLGRFGSGVLWSGCFAIGATACTLLVAVVILRTAVLPRWLGASGAVLALGIAAGLAEPAGWQLGGTINTLSYLLWAVWLIAVGVTVLVRRVKPALGASSSPSLAQSAAL